MQMAHIRRMLSLAAGALLLGLLASCGGGGSEPTYRVTLSPSPLEAFAYDSARPGPTVTVRARFDDLPAGPVYPVIVLDAPNFVEEAISVRQLSDRIFEANLNPATQRPAGVHTGVLSLKLCKDAGCASAYQLSGADLPYELTVARALRATMKLNGVFVPDGAGGRLTAEEGDYVDVIVANGDTVEVLSSIDVDWSASTSDPGVTVSGVQATKRRWRGTFSGHATVDVFSIIADARDPRQEQTMFRISVLDCWNGQGAAASRRPMAAGPAPRAC